MGCVVRRKGEGESKRREKENDTIASTCALRLSYAFCEWVLGSISS